MIGRARDYRTDESGRGEVLAEGGFRLSMTEDKTITAIEADPPHAAVAFLQPPADVDTALHHAPHLLTAHALAQLRGPVRIPLRPGEGGDQRGAGDVVEHEGEGSVAGDQFR